MTTRRRRPTRTERGLSLEQLDGWFLALEPPARVEGVSMLDGYLTAIVIGPRSIPPEEWFDDLFGARGNIAIASGTMLAAITSIVARFNTISEELSAEPPRHAPIFRKTDEGLAVPHLWCMGFLAGMRLRMDAWRPLLDQNRVDHGLMLPILLRRSIRPSDARTASRGARNRGISPHGVPGHPTCRARDQGVLDAGTSEGGERSTLTAVGSSHRLQSTHHLSRRSRNQ